MAVDVVKQDYLGDLNRKTRWELIELLERQEKILSNRNLAQKLPDKGEKVRKRGVEIKKILDEREKAMDVTTDLLSKMEISSTVLDSDDDFEEKMNETPNVFETLATNTSTAQAQKITRDYSGSGVSGHDRRKEFYPNLVDSMDEITANRESRINRLNKPVKPKSEFKFKKGKDEESAVVYPIGPHPVAKTLTLNDSLTLQNDYIDKLKEIEIKQASTKLKGTPKLKSSDYVPDPVMKMTYREKEADSD